MLVLEKVAKHFLSAQGSLTALDNVSLQINSGEFVAILGKSGSGKSSLLNILGCLELPDAGVYRLEGQNVAELSEQQLALVRNQHIGFVFQQFNLIPRMTALANVELPMEYAGIEQSVRRKKALIALTAMGLDDRLLHTPAQLSGGQQQRVAIARAIVNNPSLILADEPTGALDRDTAEEIFYLLQILNQRGKTIILVTHDEDLAARTQRIVRLENGRVVS